MQHVVWSTLEDVRQWVPLSDDRLPTLHGKYKCPHFDSKGEMDKVFTVAGQTVNFYDVPFDTFRALGFRGAEDLGNMFEFQAMLGDEFLKARDPKRSRELNPALLDFDAWLAQNAAKIPVA